MAVGIASGLGATWGMSTESSVGTFATPTRWIPHTKAEFHLKKKPVVSQALRGNRFLLASRRNILSYTVDGTAEIDIATRQFGMIWQQALGSSPGTPTNLGASGAYLQTHTPGTLEGQTLSMQKGVPTTGGTIQALSYNGLKVLDWTISVARDQMAKLSLTLDGWNEATGTSYTSASYLTAASAPTLYDFSLGSLSLGGTITFNTSSQSTTTGTTPTGLVSSYSIKGVNKYKVDRFPLGAQVKKEQISNAFTEITGEIEIEFANLTDYYNAFTADTTTAMVFSMVGRTAIASSYYPTLQLACPAVKFEEGPITETGPDVIMVKVPFTAYDDGAGDPVVQLQYISADSSV